MKISIFTYLLLTTLFNHQIPKDNVVVITKAESLINTTVNEVPTCTTLDDFRSTIGISWIAVPDATGYIINIGTTSGGSDIANMVDVVNTNVYNSPITFPPNSEIFVTIIPYNTNGQAVGCSEESFFVPDTPGCSNLIFPEYDSKNVAVDTDIIWSASTNTTGYTIGIGTTIGSDDILSTIDVGNVTSFNPPFDLPSNTEIHVTITSYNNSAMETVCGADMFTTGSTETLGCTSLGVPLNNETNVPITTVITWIAVSNATGYLITIGTTPQGTDIANMIDVGYRVTYTPMSPFPESTEVFVTIIPYNDSGQASGCIEESFITDETLVLPSCSSLLTPLDGDEEVPVSANITWNAVVNATGYRLSIGTTSGGTELINKIDVGNVLSYTPMNTLPENTKLFATILPYNASGEAYGCLEETFTTYSFNIETPTFFIPNYFTPNGDFINDVWKIEDPENHINIMHIFDRYGKLLKSNNTGEYNWDGNYNNKALPASDYWYIVQLHSGEKLSGHFTLKR